MEATIWGSVCVVLIFINTVLSQEERIDILPRSKVVLKATGENLALTCKPVVTDTSLITQIEWLDPRNRRIEAGTKSHMYVQSFVGDPNLMLIFPAITAEYAGTYTCRAKYANSLELSGSITVETFEDITFVDAPENQYPHAHKDYKIKCEVKGNPSPTVDWYKNDRNIITQDRYIIVDGGLLIKDVRESDDGVYKCTAVVSTTGRYKSKEIKVEVLVPPKVEAIPTVSVVEGESASVKCNATGKPPPKYNWIKETTSEDLRKTNRFDVKENSGYLIINKVEFNDESIYKCVAENQAGKDETEVKIKVLVKPKIFELINVTAPIQSETKLICKASGRPAPKVIFHKLSNKSPFEFGQQKFDNRITLEQQMITEKGETIGTLIISNLNRSDDGLYACSADNTIGVAYKNGHITVEFPPTFERTKHFPPAWTWGDRPGNISCLPEAIPNATIKWMHGNVEIRNSNTFQIIETSPKSNLIVYPRGKKEYYAQYNCIATNKLGTTAQPLTLKEAYEPQRVQQVRTHSLTATTIKFNIVPPRLDDGLPLRSISVQYKPEREITWDYARNYTWSFGAPYILENLVPEVTYQFRFAARNDVGMGAWTNAETISMPRRSEPAEPKILLPSHSVIDENSNNRQDIVAVSPYADHFDLRWNVPNNNGVPITRYVIRYCKSEKVNGEWRDSDCSEEIEQSDQYTNYDLMNLSPDTTYKVELKALNAIGFSSPAQIRIKTARGMDPVQAAEKSSTISSAAIIGIVVAIGLLVLLVVDIACFCANRTGILATLLYMTRSKHHEDEDPKLGRDEREPLKTEPHMNGEKQMTVQYEGGTVYTKPGVIIGKHSAV